mmetsp:Transcript_29023/g.74465  ORF Transcript_29023/g.74465 Transcript_29023/m.74465 type:complete len:217 (+) Transcript_29023:104-754(+)
MLKSHGASGRSSASSRSLKPGQLAVPPANMMLLNSSVASWGGQAAIASTMTSATPACCMPMSSGRKTASTGMKRSLASISVCSRLAAAPRGAGPVGWRVKPRRLCTPSGSTYSIRSGEFLCFATFRSASGSALTKDTAFFTSSIWYVSSIIFRLRYETISFSRLVMTLPPTLTRRMPHGITCPSKIGMACVKEKPQSRTSPAHACAGPCPIMAVAA